MSAKILILDIETAPETAYIWKRFKETVGQTQIKHPGYLLCMAWKWYGEKEVQSIGLYGRRDWKRGNRRDDAAIVKKAHQLFCEADIIIGHNIRSFDIATLNARFAAHGMPPPSPYKVCDTIEILKKRFRLPSNSLESASHYFGIQTKDKQSFTLWRDCMDGLPDAWSKIISYCEHDVTVVEELYTKLIPWIDCHPNMGHYVSDDNVCPKCGCRELIRRGVQFTTVNQYQRFQCKQCGGWSRSRTPILGKKIISHAIVT